MGHNGRLKLDCSAGTRTRNSRASGSRALPKGLVDEIDARYRANAVATIMTVSP